MRFRAPERAAVPAVRFRHPAFDVLGDYLGLLTQSEWPDCAALNALSTQDPCGRPRFVPQDAALLADGLHYEQRIAERGMVATRSQNWHDLFNALVWLRYPALKRALNRRQVADLARHGPRQRSRGQCALTHFDEAGVLVLLDSRALLHAWDRHDWLTLFWQRRADWATRARVLPFGHALFEHLLVDGVSLVGKCLVVLGQTLPAEAEAVAMVAAAIERGALLTDPQQLRPLPLLGLPGWHADNDTLAFHLQAPSYRPLRPGRVYPAPLSWAPG